MPAPRDLPSSICVVQTQGRGLDLSGQTLRDHRLLVNVSEREALRRLRAPYFLWLAGDGAALKPQTLEECVWGLQAADWVTWLDTGTAPPPSLRRCAGPLGVSRRMLEQPESKRSGRVRRLPWNCRSGDCAGQPPSDPPAPPALQSSSLSTLHSPPFISWIPLRVKERLNALAGRSLFNLGVYLESRPRAALVAGRFVDPLDYALPPKGPRKRLGIFTSSLGAGGAEVALREIAGLIDRSRVEIILATARSRCEALLPAWRGAADRVYDAACLVPPRLTAQFLYSLALNWQFDALLLQGVPEAYALLPALKEKLPGLRAVDVLHGGEDWDLFSASLDVDDCLDRRAALSEAVKDRLWEMNVPEERIVLISKERCRALLEDLLEDR